MTVNLRLRAATAGGLLGLAAAMIPIAAQADANSAWHDYSTNGVAYKNKSRFVYSHNTYAEGDTRVANGTSVAANWMGTKARVYFQGNSLCSSSTMTYNYFATSAWQHGYTHGCGGPIYSKATSDTWNGNGYNSNSAYATDIVSG